MLGNLPVEIFTRVIHFYVGGEKGVEALKLRAVSRAFAAAIRIELVAQQPLTKLRPTKIRESKFCRARMVEILACTGVERAGYIFLPLYIKNTVEYLLSFEADASTTCRLRASYKDDICTSIHGAVHWEDVLAYLQDGNYNWSRIDPSSPQTLSSTDPTGMLCAAASVGNIDVLTTLLERTPFRANARSQLFGSPLQAAASTGQVDAIWLILSYLSDGHDHIIWRLIETIADSNRPDNPIVTFLFELDHMFHPFRFVPPEWAADIVEWAIRCNLVPVLARYACEGGHEAPGQRAVCRISLRNFHYAAVHGHVDVLRFFIEQLPSHHLHAAHIGGVQQSYLSLALCLAIKNERLSAAKLLLEHGASPNRFVEPPGAENLLGWTRSMAEDSPLRFAVAQRDASMVRLLLRYGADVRSGEFQSPRSTVWLAWKMQGEVWEAVADKMGGSEAFNEEVRNEVFGLLEQGE